MNKQQFLGASLHTGLKCICSGEYTEESEGLDDQIPFVFEIVGMNDKWVDVIGRLKTVTENQMIVDCFPIARPLSDLTKPITHNGETFVPMVELAKMCKVNLKLTGEWIVDESLAQNCVRIQDNYFWYNGDSFLYSILAKTECKMIVHNQQELLFQLIEWHFNLMDESEPFIPVTDEFNPYK